MLNEQFFRYLSSERNYSAHTQLAYETDLKGLDGFLKENIGLSLFEISGVNKVTHRHLRTWMGDLLESGLSKRTVARKLAASSSYFKFLRKTGVIETNPASRLSAPKFEKKLPSFLREEEAVNLFDQIQWPDNAAGKRDKCILEILYGCGLRRSELIGLNYSDIDFSNATLKVMGKGRRERLVPFGKHVLSAMKAWVSAAETEGVNCRGVFFVNSRGGRMDPKSVYSLVKDKISMVSTISRKSPHVLRHTFATHLLNAGADLNAIKELLGHKSLAATQVYIHNSISRLKSVYNKAHPKA